MTSRMPADERRRRLVDAAFTVVARGGLGAATTRAICDEAKMSQSVFHYCFRSKHDLLRELISVTLRGLVDSTGAARAALGAGGPPRSFHSALGVTFDALWQEARRRPERQLALYELTIVALRDPELHDLAESQYRDYYASMERGLEDIESTCGSTWTVPRTVVARMAISFFDGLVLGWLSHRDDEATQQALSAAVSAMASLGVHAAVDGAASR